MILGSPRTTCASKSRQSLQASQRKTTKIGLPVLRASACAAARSFMIQPLTLTGSADEALRESKRNKIVAATFRLRLARRLKSAITPFGMSSLSSTKERQSFPGAVPIHLEVDERAKSS